MNIEQMLAQAVAAARRGPAATVTKGDRKIVAQALTDARKRKGTK